MATRPCACTRRLYVELKPFRVRGNRVWLYDADRRPQLPYAVLDIETLRPVATNGGMKIEDSLAATNPAWFGDAR